VLKILDKDSKVRFILNDEDEEPVSIDELVLKDLNSTEKDNDGAKDEHTQ
jgi:hypothetical protein